MLKNAMLAVLIVALATARVAGAQEHEDGLAGRLHAEKAVLHVQVDVGAALDEALRAARAIDAEAAESLIRAGNELIGIAREYLAAAFEFEPAIFDRMHELRGHVVVTRMDEPLVKVHKYKVPKWDMNTGEPIPGEFEEHTWTETRAYTPSLIVRTPDEATAADLLKQVRGLVNRIAEQATEPDEVAYREVEVERGKMISFDDDYTSLGRMGPYVVLSQGIPRELWSTMMGAPDKNLGATSVYRRLNAGDSRPLATVQVAAGALARYAREDLIRELAEVEKALGVLGDAAGDEQKDELRADVERAKQALARFDVINTLLSLDRLKHAGAALLPGKRPGLARLRAMIEHERDVSPVVQELLAGPGQYRLPAFRRPDAMAVMARVDVRKLSDEALKMLWVASPKEMAGFTVALEAATAMLGVHPMELLAMLDTDLYAFIEIVEKEREIKDWYWDEQTEEPKVRVRKVKQVLPEVTLLWGVKDPQAARERLSSIFTILATRPESNAFVKKRTYRETDVFCLGLDVTEEGVFPDGTTSFAAVVVDRYLSFGSWKDVTALIRRLNAGQREVDADLQAIAHKHRDSNLVIVVPQAFQKSFRDLMRKVGQEEGEGKSKDIFDSALENLDLMVESMEIPDQDMARRVRNSLRELILAYKRIDEKSVDSMAKFLLISGTHKGNFYEVDLDYVVE